MPEEKWAARDCGKEVQITQAILAQIKRARLLDVQKKGNESTTKRKSPVKGKVHGQQQKIMPKKGQMSTIIRNID